jgi:hypothetical protein
MPFRISVVVNSYVNSDLLPRAIESILKQQFQGEFEVVVLSSHFGFEVTQSMENEARNRGVDLKVVYVPPGPVGLGLNQGVLSATGDVIALLDDDDLWEREKLSRVDEAFRDPHIVYFHNSQTFVDEENMPLPFYNVHRLIRHPASLLPTGKTVVIDASDPDALARGRAYEPDFQNSSIAIRRETLEAHLGSLRDVTRGEDTFLYYCALGSRGRLAISTDRLTRYRIHQRGVTASGSSRGSIDGRLEKYVEYADGQQHRLELVRKEILGYAIPEATSSLDSDQAFWSTMHSVATGSSTRAEFSKRTRFLLGDSYARPRPREMLALALGLLAATAPNVARTGFASWRGVW